MSDLFEILNDFESFGDNCEFGGYQRRMGVDRATLFRYSSAPLWSLIHVLGNEFAEVPVPSNIHLRVLPHTQEYMVRLRNAEGKYEFNYHTRTYAGTEDPDALHGKHCVYVAFWVRCLLETLHGGARILVHKVNTPVEVGHVLRLFEAVRGQGNSTLLFVQPPDDSHPAGSVDAVADGLLLGYHGTLAPYENATAIDVVAWESICRAAHEAWVSMRADGPRTSWGRPRTRQVVGWVEEIWPPLGLRGWALDAAHPLEGLVIQILLDGRQIGVGTTSFCRRGLTWKGNSAGFQVATDRPIDAAWLDDGRIEVLADGVVLAIAGRDRQGAHRAEAEDAGGSGLRMRLPMLDPADLTEQQRAVRERSIAALARMLKTKAPGPAPPMEAWLYSPVFADRMQSLSACFNQEGRLPRPMRELAFLITHRVFESGTEWFDRRTVIALAAGVDPEVITAIRHHREPNLPDPAARAVYAYALSLQRTRTVDQAMHDAVVGHFGHHGVVELVGVCGVAAMISTTLNAFDMSLPVRGDRSGERQP